ncbi:MAG: hypothetical protein U0350_46370 [Caldilineaceae bacterium]
MDPEEYESFVVRIWRKPATNLQERTWSGEIEQIQNGVRWGFCTLSDLLAFLQQAAGAEGTTTPPASTPTSTGDVGGNPG